MRCQLVVKMVRKIFHDGDDYRHLDFPRQAYLTALFFSFLPFSSLSVEHYETTSVNVVDGEILSITKVSRLHMAAYLCVASNGVPPSISKRVQLKVQCKQTH